MNPRPALLGRRLSLRSDARIRLVARQLALALVALATISVVTFAASNTKSPEGIAMSVLGRTAAPEQIDAYVRREGLDRPLVERYADWLGDYLRGDWGVSPVTQRPVRDEIMPRLSRTLILSFLALVIAVPVSIALGVFMARNAGTWKDLSLLIGSVVVAGMPEFVIGIGLLMVFAVSLGWLPVDSSAITFGTPAEQMKAYVLPTLTLVVAIVPYVARFARGAARETFDATYVQAAVLRGLPRRRVIWDHAMRNAAVPVVNVIALNLLWLLSGVIVVENLFGFPGVGQALVSAIGNSDAITVQAIALVMGAMFIAISLIADLLVAYFNPRLRGPQ